MSHSPEPEEITPDALYQAIRRGTPPLVLDVRNADEFASWTIEGYRPMLCSTSPISPSWRMRRDALKSCQARLM